MGIVTAASSLTASAFSEASDLSCIWTSIISCLLPILLPTSCCPPKRITSLGQLAKTSPEDGPSFLQFPSPFLSTGSWRRWAKPHLFARHRDSRRPRRRGRSNGHRRGSSPGRSCGRKMAHDGLQALGRKPALATHGVGMHARTGRAAAWGRRGGSSAQARLLSMTRVVLISPSKSSSQVIFSAIHIKMARRR